MALLLLLVMLTACAAFPQDLSGKIFTFPEETDINHVKLTPSKQEFSAVTVCFRSITDLTRNHMLFSMSMPSYDNALLIFKLAAEDRIKIYFMAEETEFGALDYRLNMWHTICSTWDSASGLVQLWFDGKPTIKRFVGGSSISSPIIILGQEQDSYGGDFDSEQSFVGMMSDVHMWDYVLSPCEILHFVNDLNFTPGNVLNWRALDFEITERVLIENEKLSCH